MNFEEGAEVSNRLLEVRSSCPERHVRVLNPKLLSAGPPRASSEYVTSLGLQVA